MSRSRFLLPLVAVAAAVSLFSCRKKDDPVVVVDPGQGDLKVEFSNVVGNEPLVLNDRWYISPANDSFKLSVYKYFVSNVQLNRADGQVFREPDSYHLINQADASSRQFTIQGLPTGKYTSMTFLIGVDSLHNVSGAQTGALDPALGMQWSWNTGYIMAKMEGTSPSSGAADQSVILHIAGFSGFFNVLKQVTLTFPEQAEVSGTNVPNVHVFSDVQEWFKNPLTISPKDRYFIMNTGKNAKEMSDNYADMFHVDHVDN